MTFLDDCLDGRSQHFTFPRRELSQKIASAALLFFVPRSQPVFEFPKKYPAPQFRIGDSVVSDGIDEDDEVDEDLVDFGEVIGLQWLPEDYSGFPANSWVYYIYWTHSTYGVPSCYPCYDVEPTGADNLRLVSND